MTAFDDTARRAREINGTPAEMATRIGDLIASAPPFTADGASHDERRPHRRNVDAHEADLAILQHPAGRAHASAAEIGIMCRMTAAEVRARLVGLGSRRPIVGRQDRDSGSPRRVFVITGEGRRAAGIINTKSTTSTNEAN